MKLTARALMAVDAAANVASGVVTLAVPSVWRSLGLPGPARVPVGLALVGSGAWHAVGVVRQAPASDVRVSAGLNAGWTLATLAAQAFPHTIEQRTALGLIASYDGTMAPLKLALPRT